MKTANGKVRVHPSLSVGIYDFCAKCAKAGFIGHSPSEVAGKLAEWKAVELIASGVDLPPANVSVRNNHRSK